MRNARKICGAFVAAAFSLAVLGCQSGGRTDDRPQGDPKPSTQSKGEHPKGQQPKSEHPQGEYPKSEHPKPK